MSLFVYPLLIRKGRNTLEKKKRTFQELYDWTESIVCAIAAVVVLFTFVARTSVVSGSSMNETLQGGDMLVISRLGKAPSQGDIVVVTKPYSRGEPIIKRVIATGGQTVDINFDRGVVFVDGEQLDESYVNTPTNVSYDVQFPVTVPEGSVFCLGDNRNHSYDSRASEIGMIDERYVLGKVLWRIFPFHSIGNPDQ